MTPTPVATAIIDPWYSGPLTAQTLQALTVQTPMPPWFLAGLVIGIMLGVVLIMATDLWKIRRK